MIMRTKFKTIIIISLLLFAIFSRFFHDINKEQLTDVNVVNLSYDLLHNDA